MQDKQEKVLILKKTKFGESDLIIQAINSIGARLSFIAKGALKSKKRFGGGVLEPTHFVLFSYKQGSSSQLLVLTEAQIIDDFPGLRKDYDRLEFSLMMLNCVYHVSQEGDIGSEFLFNLLGHSLRFLNSQQAIDIRIFKMHFYLKFLFQQGVVSIDPWMSPFLKVNISESIGLHTDQNVKIIVDEYLDSIESLVLNYIKTAII